jgi:Caspase domain/Sel1 repeat
MNWCHPINCLWQDIPMHSFQTLRILICHFLCVVFFITLGACASRPVDVNTLDSYEIVDCELPGPILRVGAGYATTGRAQALRTGASECALRGGAYSVAGRSSYETSLKVWLPLAADGDKQAQTYVGQIYEKGLGRPADFVKAAEWYKKAADQDFPPAQTALAMLYERGIVNGKAEPLVALALYRKAAQLNEALAFQRDVVSRDQEIADLKVELEKSRADSKQQGEELRRQQNQLKGQIDGLKRELAQARIQQDQERIKRFEKELRERQEEEVKSKDKLSSADADVARTTVALASIEKEPVATDAALPQIQLLEPMSIAMRGVMTVRIRPNVKEIPVVAKVIAATAAAPVSKVMVNDIALTPDAEGIVRTIIAVTGKTTAVQIIAIDNAGKRASLPFVMASSDIVRETARVTPLTRGFGNYYALIIGNASYKYWDKLNTPTADAQAVGAVLEQKYGFKVTTLLDASRGRIFKEVARLRSTLTENDNLLIYYSGHGYWDAANLKGYWVPVDGEKENIANYISSSDITEQLSALRARQVLVVADACYAGVLVRSVAEQLDRNPSASKSDWLQNRAQLQSRKVMSSGGVRQVMDGGAGKHSIFARQFLDGLARKMEAFEAHELYRDIAPRVEKAALGFGEQQRPQYGQLQFSGHVGGDFVFVPKG